MNAPRPVTDVYVWNSFSCNNSSDYRLVAEFDSPKAAEAMRAELAKFFAAHAKAYDEQSDADDFDWPGEATDVARALGKKYGHTWKEFLVWGDEQLTGDEPQVGVLAKSVVLYHGYSSGGFGPDLPRVLEKAGAKLVEKGAKGGPPVLYGSFAVSKDGKLEKSLAKFFDQRLGNERHLSDWTWPSWAKEDGTGKAEDVTFIVADGRCTFTLPLVAGNIAPFRKSLASAKDLELRIATKADISQNRKREEKLAAATAGAPAKAFLEQTTKAKLKSRGAFAVTTLFHYDKKVNGADDIVVAGGEVVAFAGDKGKTQRLVVRGGKTRAATNLAFPKSWLQGVLVEPDGTLRAGGEKGRIYVSGDAGKTWEEEKHVGLAAALEGERIWSLCRYQGALWAAGKGGVARQIDGKWMPVVVPSAVRAKQPSSYSPNVFLPRLVVVEDTLYVLGFGIARWDGKKLAVELDAGHDVEAMTVTDKGTLLAVGAWKTNPKTSRIEAGRTVWRRPRGGKWVLLGEKAIDVGALSADHIARKISFNERFKGVFCVDGAVVLLGENERPDSQMNAVRVSEDDGVSFRRMTVSVDGHVVVTAAVADGRGGVLVGGQGGVLLRVSRDGLGDWTAQPGTAPKQPERVAAKSAPKKPSAGGVRRFELVEGSSSKFWEIHLDGASLSTRFGRIGASGQVSTKSFDSEDKAKKEYERLVAEKTKKGYSEK